MRDYRYSLEIMKQQLENKYISPEIKYAFKASIEALEEQSSGGWILASERLPTREEYNKNDGRFIVTDGMRRYQSLFDIHETKFFIDIVYKGKCGFDEIVDNKVIAWQPLPGVYVANNKHSK